MTSTEILATRSQISARVGRWLGFFSEVFLYSYDCLIYIFFSCALTSPKISSYVILWIVFFSCWFRCSAIILRERACFCESVPSLQRGHVFSCWLLWKLSLKLFLWVCHWNCFCGFVNSPFVRYSWGEFVFSWTMNLTFWWSLFIFTNWDVDNCLIFFLMRTLNECLSRFDKLSSMLKPIFLNVSQQGKSSHLLGGCFSLPNIFDWWALLCFVF